MRDKVRLKVLGISYSQVQSGVCALIMAESNGPMRIPIVIGQAEAQSIAICMEGIKPPRPLTHDLFSSFMRAYGIALMEVFIYKFEDGVFHSELSFTDGERQIVIDARTSDAVAIAIRTKAPIYTTPEVIKETGFVMEEHTVSEDESPEEILMDNDPDAEPLEQSDSAISRLTIQELEKTLQSYIKSEQYEKAAQIQSLIDKKRAEQSDDNSESK